MRPLVCTALLFALASPPVSADHCHGGAHDVPTTSPSAEPRTRAVSVPDVTVVDQDGRALRFHSDLVKGRVVVISFIYTTCTTVCPVIGASQLQLRRHLGDRVGRDVHLVSITLDPVNDTPRRLREWGAKFQAGGGWTLVTGAKDAVDRLLKGLGAFTPDKEAHAPFILVGNDVTGVWERTSGFTPPARLAELIDTVAQR
ncbi:MAG: SCO family protein [Myxococcota bacterium]